MFSFLKRPYRVAGTKKSRILSTAAFGLFIFLFLYIFKPFGLFQLKGILLLLVALGFGIITASVLFVFKFIFEPLVIGDNWIMGKEITWDLLIVVCIGVANYFYVQIIFRTGFNLKYLLYFIWTAILVGIIPAIISYIVEYNNMYRIALQEADIQVNKLIPERVIIITAGYERNDFRINPNDIIYLTSNDNYVTIVTISDGVQNKKTMRGTLKAAENELRKLDMFLRCHKCYIINLDYVESITGNSQNMKIRLNLAGIEIPVSRLKAVTVAGKLRKQKF